MPEASRLFDLSGKAAFVPGGYGALGAAIAWALARAGAAVAIAGRDDAKAQALAAAMRDEGHEAIGVGIDTHSVSSIRAAVDATAEAFGRVDILMNCVGIQREQALLDVTEEAWDEVVDVNLKGAMFLGQAVARHQVAAGRGGRQVHLLSVRAQLGMKNRGYSAYCGSKGGLATLIRQHAVELARHRITVNGIAPTVVRTPMGSHWLTNPATATAIVERIPLGRVGEPEDLVGAAVFFCAPASDFITGQVLYVDGGLTATQ